MSQEEDLRMALADALAVIERLADQQAMSDDWYVEKVAEILAVLNGA